MKDLTNVSWDWEGEYLRVKVLFSSAGLATQIIVEDRDEKSIFLIDVGDGILRDLIALPKEYYENIHAIMITHGHFDHVGGLFSLLGFLRMINRQKKLIILSPPNVTELKGIIRAFLESYKDSMTYEIEVQETNERTILNKITITPFRVQHRGSIVGMGELPKIPSVGYIVEKEQEKVLYTGDTGYFEDLKKHLKDINFALIEGTNIDKKTSYHLSIPEAEQLGAIAKEYKIVHQVHFRNH